MGALLLNRYNDLHSAMLQKLIEGVTRTQRHRQGPASKIWGTARSGTQRWHTGVWNGARRRGGRVGGAGGRRKSWPPGCTHKSLISRRRRAGAARQRRGEPPRALRTHTASNQTGDRNRGGRAPADAQQRGGGWRERHTEREKATTRRCARGNRRPADAGCKQRTAGAGCCIHAVVSAAARPRAAACCRTLLHAAALCCRLRSLHAGDEAHEAARRLEGGGGLLRMRHK